MTYLRRRLSFLLVADVPPLAASLLIAELFFKFGSFTLEAIAFLAVWRVLGWAYERTLIATRLVPDAQATRFRL